MKILLYKSHKKSDEIPLNPGNENKQHVHLTTIRLQPTYLRSSAKCGSGTGWPEVKATRLTPSALLLRTVRPKLAASTESNSTVKHVTTTKQPQTLISTERRKQEVNRRRKEGSGAVAADVRAAEDLGAEWGGHVKKAAVTQHVHLIYTRGTAETSERENETENLPVLPVAAPCALFPSVFVSFYSPILCHILSTSSTNHNQSR